MAGMPDESSLRCIKCEYYCPRIVVAAIDDDTYLLLTQSFNFRFGIEFAPEVVLADGSVKNLAWRVCNAKKVLVSLHAMYPLPVSPAASN